MTKYQFVSTTETEGFVTQVFDTADEAAEELMTDAYVKRSDPRLRAELQGQPGFFGFVGPMWGGVTPDGEPVIRYEDPTANRAFSQ